jgi:hypothetical protein
VLARRHDYTEPSAGVDVDVRIDAPLADQPQFGKAFQQGRADFGALADEDQRLAGVEPFSQRVDVLHMVAPDCDVVAGQLAEAALRTKRVEGVVQDRDLHASPPPVLPPGECTTEASVQSWVSSGSLTS